MRGNNKVFIAVGLNENVTRAQNANVAITPDEIARDVKSCLDEGASIVHLHARDPKTGAPHMNNVDTYLKIFRAIKQVADIPCYPTYPPAPTAEERWQHVLAILNDRHCKLEIAPIIAGSTNLTTVDPKTKQFTGRSLDNTILTQSMGHMLKMVQWAKQHDLFVSHDVFEAGHVRQSAALWQMGMYHRPVLLKFFMSERTMFGFPPEVKYLQTFAGMPPPEMDHEWLFMPYGVNHARNMELSKWAILNGGNVRVGIGDNPSGEGYLPTNAQRIREMASLIRSLGKEVATVADVRKRFAPIAGPSSPSTGSGRTESMWRAA